MSIVPVNVLSAYANAAGIARTPGMERPDGAVNGQFSSILDDAAKQAMTDLRKGEQMSAKAVTGKADLVDVVSAVNNAETTLQTVVAVRDKVIQAYQDIARMPI